MSMAYPSEGGSVGFGLFNSLILTVSISNENVSVSTTPIEGIPFYLPISAIMSTWVLSSTIVHFYVT